MPKSKKRSSAKHPIQLGIIGGSGLYSMPGLSGAREVRVKTPFGDPSDAFITGTLEGRRVAFLARHGRGHLLSPSEINYRANIFAIKLLGAERIISVSAVGSLRDDLPPLDFLIPDQFFDRTRLRVATFFGGGIVAHVGFDKPTCTHLSAHLAGARHPHRSQTDASGGKETARTSRGQIPLVIGSVHVAAGSRLGCVRRNRNAIWQSGKDARRRRELFRVRRPPLHARARGGNGG